MLKATLPHVTPVQAKRLLELTALLNNFTDLLRGTVPASGGGTANFLRADGSWAAPAGGVTGSGSAPCYPNWSAATVLGDPQHICEDGIGGLSISASADDSVSISSGGGLTGFLLMKGGPFSTSAIEIAEGAGAASSLGFFDSPPAPQFTPTSIPELLTTLQVTSPGVGLGLVGGSSLAGSAIVSDVAIADDGEEVAVSLSATPTNLIAGAVYQAYAAFFQTGTAGAGPSVRYRLRIGPTTLIGAEVCSILGSAPVVAFASGVIRLEFTVRSAGEVRGNMSTGFSTGATGTSASICSGTIADATVANLIELTADPRSAGVTFTFTEATIIRIR